MKRLTNIVQIVAVVLTAFFVVCLFTSSFPPWSSDDDGGAGAAANTTVVAAGTTAAGAGTTAGGGAATTAGEGAGTTAGGGAATTAPANDIDGQALYDDQCASCHSEDGSGGFGPSLQGIQDRFSEDEEADIIANGQGSMPGFSGDLSAEEIAAIVAYTRTLG
jgi:mono/diheme cytochrome c family protein